MSLLIGGDSHVEALASGYKRIIERQESPSSVEFFALGSAIHMTQPFFEWDGIAIRFLVEEYVQNTKRVLGVPFTKRDNTRVGLVMGFHTARVFRHEMWRRFAPWSVCDNPNSSPVSDGAIELMAAQDATNVVEFFEAVRRMGQDLFVIAAPAPRRSHYCIREGTPKRTVIAIDKIYRRYIAHKLDQTKIEYVPSPAETIDAEGFLKPELESQAAGDDHHANAEYGELLVRTILARFGHEQMTDAQR